MGAKFAPSLTNIFMAKWEGDVVYAQGTTSLVLWARYINDILLLWNGSLASLERFFGHLNTNDRGISLTYEASTEKIHFLDLEIRITNRRFLNQQTVTGSFPLTVAIITHGSSLSLVANF